jgi:hypothetical protein
MSNETDKLEPAPEKVKSSWFWMKNSNGEASATITFTTISFVVTTLAYIASIFESIGPVSFRAFDAGACSAYFIPILTLYFGRRWTEARKAV